MLARATHCVTQFVSDAPRFRNTRVGTVASVLGCLWLSLLNCSQAAVQLHTWVQLLHPWEETVHPWCAHRVTLPLSTKQYSNSSSQPRCKSSTRTWRSCTIQLEVPQPIRIKLVRVSCTPSGTASVNSDTHTCYECRWHAFQKIGGGHLSSDHQPFFINRCGRGRYDYGLLAWHRSDLLHRMLARRKSFAMICELQVVNLEARNQNVTF